MKISNVSVCSIDEIRLTGLSLNDSLDGTFKYINTKTDIELGEYLAINFPWSKDTIEALKNLKDLMEKDVINVVFGNALLLEDDDEEQDEEEDLNNHLSL